MMPAEDWEELSWEWDAWAAERGDGPEASAASLRRLPDGTWDVRVHVPGDFSRQLTAGSRDDALRTAAGESLAVAIAQAPRLASEADAHVALRREAEDAGVRLCLFCRHPAWVTLTVHGTVLAEHLDVCWYCMTARALAAWRAQWAKGGWRRRQPYAWFPGEYAEEWAARDVPAASGRRAA